MAKRWINAYAMLDHDLEYSKSWFFTDDIRSQKLPAAAQPLFSALHPKTASCATVYSYPW